MNRSAIDQLREANPHHETLPAPPIAPLLERLESRTRIGARPRRRMGAFSTLAFPAITVAVAIGVLAIVLLSVRPGRGSHQTAAPQPRRVTPAVSLKPPRTGMAGSVTSFGSSALAASGSGVVSMQQCLGCKPDGNSRPGVTTRDWLLTTDPSGAGTLRTVPYELAHPQLSGANGWASGTTSEVPAGAGPTTTGAGPTMVAEFFVTHDGGRHWSVAPAAAPNYGGQQLSFAYGEVWTVGQPGGSTVVLHAKADASRLAATASEPIHAMWPNAQVAAAGPGRAYLYDGDPTVGTMYSTSDDGRSWQRLASPCAARQDGSLISPAAGGTVWVSCNGAHGSTVLSRSTDGGRHWTELATPFTAGYDAVVEPVSAGTLWAQTGNRIVRSTDGGGTWQTVWSLSQQVPALRHRSQPGIYPGDLLAAGSGTATMQFVVTHGRPGSKREYANLVRYRTTNGGRTWTPQIVSLATR